MFQKILIANRGEIAVRIIRACREMGIATVAVYSEADKEAMHVMLADEAVCIGPAKSSESYLNVSNIIGATILTGATAIHPGFGFLSENATFARMCEDCNIAFIGPSADMIELMGDKAKARETVSRAGVPVIPGTEGAVTDAVQALQEAQRIGFPVMIKAAAGGGGKGMRIARTKEEFTRAFEAAQSEAKAAFGDDTIYLEKLIERPRHIEIQLAADKYGNTIHLGERDCSIQRKNQKVLEESPSPAITQEQRERMGRIAVEAAKAVQYESLGTIEFLLDKDNQFYFMEMNTRIQVEHPVTEMVTGIDMVKEQIRIAAGEKLSVTQEEVYMNGHAIECRINAENPQKGFRPSPGTIQRLFVPGGFGVRIETAMYQGYKIPPMYDSMVAKVIVHGKNREEALMRMRRALEELVVEGIDTNIEFDYNIINQPEYETGNYDTGFIEKLLKNEKK